MAVLQLIWGVSRNRYLNLQGNPYATLDPEILADYDRRPDETRLERGLFQLEALRTRRLIQRHAPPPPPTALDVGGAAGAYAAWLSKAYFHLPQEFEVDVSAAGFEVAGVHGIEGPARMLAPIGPGHTRSNTGRYEGRAADVARSSADGPSARRAGRRSCAQPSSFNASVG
jgi:hypothetical protein